MSEPFLAEIKIISWNFPPKGWAFCNGQALPINQNQALFSLLGTTYGGNGQTTFALPDLRGRSPVHFGPQTNLGQVGGQEAHTLSLQELPTHTHQIQANSGSVDISTPVGSTWGNVTNGDFYSAAPDAAMNPSIISPTGGGQPHPNMQPYLTLNFVIALQGIFPSTN